MLNLPTKFKWIPVQRIHRMVESCRHTIDNLLWIDNECIGNSVSARFLHGVVCNGPVHSPQRIKISMQASKQNHRPRRVNRNWNLHIQIIIIRCDGMKRRCACAICLAAFNKWQICVCVCVLNSSRRSYAICARASDHSRRLRSQMRSSSSSLLLFFTVSINCWRKYQFTMLLSRICACLLNVAACCCCPIARYSGNLHIMLKCALNTDCGYWCRPEETTNGVDFVIKIAMKPYVTECAISISTTYFFFCLLSALG